MKTLKYLPIAILLVALACSSKNEQSSSNLPNNTPLGQASVVDEDSEPNILQVAIGSEDHSSRTSSRYRAYFSKCQSINRFCTC